MQPYAGDRIIIGAMVRELFKNMGVDITLSRTVQVQYDVHNLNC